MNTPVRATLANTMYIIMVEVRWVARAPTTATAVSDRPSTADWIGVGNDGGWTRTTVVGASSAATAAAGVNANAAASNSPLAKRRMELSEGMDGVRGLSG